MKKCIHCNNENLDEALFCTSCGKKFEEVQNSETVDQVVEPIETIEAVVEKVVETVEPEEVEAVAEEIKPEEVEAVAEETEPEEVKAVVEEMEPEEVEAVVEEIEPEEVEAVAEEIEPEVTEAASETVDSETKKSKMGILGIILPIGLVAVVGIGFLLVHFFIALNPVNRIAYGLNKFASQSQYDVAVSLETDLGGIADDLTEEFDTELLLSANRKNGELVSAFSLGYDGDEILDFVVAQEKNMVYLDIPQVIEKDEYLYYEIEDLDEDTIKEICKYVNMINLKKVDEKDYLKAISTALDGKINKGFNKVSMELDGEDLLDLTEEILSVLEDDEKLPKTIQKNGIDIFSKMIKDEFEIADLDEDIWEEALDSFEDKDFFDDWEDTVEDFVDGFESSREYSDLYDSDFEVEIIVHFGLFNKIKKIEVIPQMYSEEITLVFELGRGYKTSRKYSDKKGNDIERLDFDEYLELGEEVVDYIDDYVKDNDEVNDLVEDLLKDNGYDDTEEFFEDLIQELMYSFW